MSNTVVTGTITGTISEYHDLTQQDIRDSMKLAPSAGAAAANSIDDKIDDIVVDPVVNVLPFTGSTPDRTAGTTITCFFKEAVPVTVSLDDATLDNLTLEFQVENAERTDTLTIANGSITRNGSSFTVTITTAVTNNVGNYTWSLRDTSNDEVLGYGLLVVKYAAWNNA
jgi:hypothetical protein